MVSRPAPLALAASAKSKPRTWFVTLSDPRQPGGLRPRTNATKALRAPPQRAPDRQHAVSTERSHARQIEDLGVRVSRAQDEHQRLSQRKEELDDEIHGQQQALGGLQEAKLDLLRTRAAADERVKARTPLV